MIRKTPIFARDPARSASRPTGTTAYPGHSAPIGDDHNAGDDDRENHDTHAMRQHRIATEKPALPLAPACPPRRMKRRGILCLAPLLLVAGIAFATGTTKAHETGPTAAPDTLYNSHTNIVARNRHDATAGITATGMIAGSGPGTRPAPGFDEDTGLGRASGQFDNAVISTAKLSAAASVPHPMGSSAQASPRPIELAQATASQIPGSAQFLSIPIDAINSATALPPKPAQTPAAPETQQGNIPGPADNPLPTPTRLVIPALPFAPSKLRQRLIAGGASLPPMDTSGQRDIPALFYRATPEPPVVGGVGIEAGVGANPGAKAGTGAETNANANPAPISATAPARPMNADIRHPAVIAVPDCDGQFPPAWIGLLGRGGMDVVLISPRDAHPKQDYCSEGTLGDPKYGVTFWAFDIISTLAELVKRPDIDPGRIAVFGYGYGAAAAQFAILRNGHAGRIDPRLRAAIGLRAQCMSEMDNLVPSLLIGVEHDPFNPPAWCMWRHDRDARHLRPGQSPVILARIDSNGTITARTGTPGDTGDAGDTGSIVPAGNISINGTPAQIAAITPVAQDGSDSAPFARRQFLRAETAPDMRKMIGAFLGETGMMDAARRF